MLERNTCPTLNITDIDDVTKKNGLKMIMCKNKPCPFQIWRSVHEYVAMDTLPIVYTTREDHAA